MALAIVTRIPTLMEAQIAVAALRAYGIDAQLFDGNFGAMESPVIEALGGFRVMAPEAQVEAARDTLQALRANPAPVDPDEAGPWAPSLRDARRTRGRGMRLLALVLLSAPFVLWLLARLVSGLAPTGDDPDLAHLRLSIEPLALSPPDLRPTSDYMRPLHGCSGGVRQSAWRNTTSSSSGAGRAAITRRSGPGSWA